VFRPLTRGFCENAFRLSRVVSRGLGCHPIATLSQFVVERERLADARIEQVDVGRERERGDDLMTVADADTADVGDACPDERLKVVTWRYDGDSTDDDDGGGNTGGDQLASANVSFTFVVP
jgi:hypothetical protein